MCSQGIRGQRKETSKSCWVTREEFVLISFNFYWDEMKLKRMNECMKWWNNEKWQINTGTKVTTIMQKFGSRFISFVSWLPCKKKKSGKAWDCLLEDALAPLGSGSSIRVVVWRCRLVIVVVSRVFLVVLVLLVGRVSPGESGEWQQHTDGQLHGFCGDTGREGRQVVAVAKRFA